MALIRARSGVVAVLLIVPLSLPAQIPQTFATDGDVGRHTSITVDASNNPRISYFDATNTSLKSIWKTDIWYGATVDSVGNVGEYGSIAVSPAPILTFISYYDAGNEYLKLAVGNFPPYTLERLPLSVRLMARTSIALNLSSITPIIAFFDVNDRNLKLAMFDRGAMFSSPPLSYSHWGLESVTAVATNVEDLALVLDTGSEPHLAYIEQTRTTAILKYANKNCLASGCLTQITAAQQTGQGTWSIETVPGTGLVGTSVALALDPATGNPLIAYYSGGQLKYAVKAGGSWSIETVDASADVGRYVSIALSTSGDPNLIYYDATNGNLKHAVKAGGTWTVSTIDDTPDDVGQYTDVAIGTDDVLHATYYDVTNADLKYAGPQRHRNACCAAAGTMAMVLFVPLFTAGFWRRRVRHERG